jgi:cell filamentation protein
VTFDVFGDFETRGYLRNSEGLKDLAQVKRLEHRVFLRNLEFAVEYLKRVEPITYQNVLDTHKILFHDLYRWAGQDRQATAPDIAIARGMNPTRTIQKNLALNNTTDVHARSTLWAHEVRTSAQLPEGSAPRKGIKQHNRT